MKHQFAYAASVKRGIRWLAKRDRKALLKIRDVPFIGQHPCAVDDDHLKLVPVAREADTIGQISGDEVPKKDGNETQACSSFPSAWNMAQSSSLITM